MSEFNNSVEPFIEQDPMHLHERDSDQDDGSARAAKDPGYDIPLKDKGLLPGSMMGFGPLLLPTFPPIPATIVQEIAAGLGAGPTINLPPGIWLIALTIVIAPGASWTGTVVQMTNSAGLEYTNVSTVEVDQAYSLPSSLSVMGIYPGNDQITTSFILNGDTPGSLTAAGGFYIAFKLA